MSLKTFVAAMADRRFKGIDRFALFAAADNGGHISPELIMKWANCSEEKALRCLDRLSAKGLLGMVEGRLVWSEVYILDHEQVTVRRSGPPQFVVSRSRRNRLYARDNHECVYCGTEENLCLDHVHPRSKGGADTDDNLVTCCRSCNSRKGARSPEEWVQ